MADIAIAWIVCAPYDSMLSLFAIVCDHYICILYSKLIFMSSSRDGLRSRSAPASGNPRNQESRERETQFLSVNRSTTRGGLTSSTLRQEPTNSSSGSSRNDYSFISRTTPTVAISLENGTKVNSEITSAAPSSAASTTNDPWKRKTLLTLGKCNR